MANYLNRLPSTTQRKENINIIQKNFDIIQFPIDFFEIFAKINAVTMT